MTSIWERISKSSMSYKEDHREKVCKQCQEKGPGMAAYANKNVRCTSSRKDTERKKKYQEERLV